MIDGVSADFIAALFSMMADAEGFAGLSNLVSLAAGAKSGAVWVVDKGEIIDISMAEDGKETAGPYAAHFHKHDIWQANLRKAPHETVYLACDHTPEDVLTKTEFYADFLRPYGMFRPLGILVDLRPDTIATIGIERLHARTLFDDDDKPALGRLIPYVKSALQLRLRLRDEKQRNQAYRSSLDALSFGAIICNAQAGIIFANAAAEELAREGAGIVLGPRGKGLRAIVPAESKRLAHLIHDTANGGPGGVLRLTGQDSVPAFALVTPLPGRDGRGSLEHALVSVRSARDRPSFTTASLAALFQLSPAQAEIAIALYNGQSPDEIAAARNVRISTLRTHLAEIFARTGTENQRDFVRLLGMLPQLRPR